jgi:hypothetical protein
METTIEAPKNFGRFAVHPNNHQLTAADRDALTQLWNQAGAWAADTWTRLNRELWDSEIPYRGVVFGLTPHGGHLAHCSQTGRITLHPALLDPQGETIWHQPHSCFGVAYAEDVLTHEMIHALFRARGIPSSGAQGEHNTKHWCEEITRLSTLLGLGEIKAQRITPRRGLGRVAKPGYLTQLELATWPHSLRPKGHYEAKNQKIRVPI